MENAIKSENNADRDAEGHFLPGHSIKSEGRPVGSISITSAIKKKLEEIPQGQKISYLEAFVLKTLQKAINEGDVQAQKMIWNYVDGMPKESKDITTGGKPFYLPSELLEKHDINSSSKDNSER